MASKIKALFSRPKGQAMAEFSMALPILLFVVFGLLEAGRAVFMYAAVTNASREAVRYATAYGVDENDVLHYQNCAEIRNVAKRVGFLLPLSNDDIDIEYDSGPDPDTGIVPSPFASCAPGEDVNTSVELACGDRVVVTVTVDYEPILSLVPLSARSFESSSARTFLGVVKLVEDAEVCN